ncbi:hypothetical protein C7M84_011423 [Penaeus vannamei]|uniref:Centrosomal protein CEP104 Zn finger domain-containing protein n=1 Tax=Penaeus vannamei TaxID=6689 RepID=A0A3R7NYG8_PENVA|nr:hypothetical protein C7M84_011423 [Penaeus vannamei]
MARVDKMNLLLLLSIDGAAATRRGTVIYTPYGCVTFMGLGYCRKGPEFLTCIFCGAYDESFSDNGLDMHYWRACPMLTRCHYCRQVVEVASLTQHLSWRSVWLQRSTEGATGVQKPFRRRFSTTTTLPPSRVTSIPTSLHHNSIISSPFTTTKSLKHPLTSHRHTHSLNHSHPASHHQIPKLIYIQTLITTHTLTSHGHPAFPPQSHNLSISLILRHHPHHSSSLHSHNLSKLIYSKLQLILTINFSLSSIHHHLTPPQTSNLTSTRHPTHHSPLSLALPHSPPQCHHNLIYIFQFHSSSLILTITHQPSPPHPNINLLQPSLNSPQRHSYTHSSPSHHSILSPSYLHNLISIFTMISVISTHTHIITIPAFPPLSILPPTSSLLHSPVRIITHSQSHPLVNLGLIHASIPQTLSISAIIKTHITLTLQYPTSLPAFYPQSPRAYL